MKKEINVILGERIKALRKQKGYTREAFAEKLSVSTRFLAAVESGEAGVSLSTLKKIVLALDTSADYLIGVKNEMGYDFYRQSAINKISKIDGRYLMQINKILEGFDEIVSINQNTEIL
ncbi:MAG: helix-turn-helix transcriptional regulator [Clostridia bacterium]|nr:helix-turn-helix transcriptional regulator [Clostridia bacterium]